MFAGSYWGNRFYGGEYWGHVGGVPVVVVVPVPTVSAGGGGFRSPFTYMRAPKKRKRSEPRVFEYIGSGGLSFGGAALCGMSHVYTHTSDGGFPAWSGTAEIHFWNVAAIQRADRADLEWLLAA